MDNDGLEELRNAIFQQLQAARALASKLEKAYRDLLPNPAVKEYANGKYAGKLVWLAIRDYLQESGPSTVSDIIEELQNEGVDLGKYPRRTVKSSIGSSYIKGVFLVEATESDEIVSLGEHQNNAGGQSAVRQPKRKPRKKH